MKIIARKIVLFQYLLIIGACITTSAQQVKNVILMIPDGCSLATVSTARWYQWFNNPDKEHLYIDPYICGTVRTTCSNAPIGDSAPTTSCYMTGYMSRAGWVSTYPPADPANDIYSVDPNKAYQPLATVLEAAKLMGMKTGLVFTCYFPHATPADCSAHSYDRNKFEWIATQQAHNKVNVVIGGGTSMLPAESEEYLNNSGWTVIKDNINEMRLCNNNNMWALFCPKDMPYEIDRDTIKYPSLAEMTNVAISKLSKSRKGFFLMVEGSQIDYAAHNNDPGSLFSEFLSFDEACHVALEFAKKDGNTAVIILPDHGNSGLSIGRRNIGNYAGTPKKAIFGNLKNFKASSEEMARKVNQVPFDSVQGVFKRWLGFELTQDELEFLKNCNEYTQSPISREQRKQVSGIFYSTGLSRTIAQFMTARTGLAFTSNGHTGEDVFLAVYHPNAKKRPTGMLTNIEINDYLCSLIGITHANLDDLTKQFFVPHREIVKDDECTITKVALTTTSNVGKGRRSESVRGGVSQAPQEVMALTIKTANSDIILKQSSNLAEIHTHKGGILDVKVVELPTVVVYVDKNNTFYIPRNILSLAG